MPERAGLSDVRRIVIVGCAGSGKSSLGKALGLALGLPVIERDELGTLGSRDYIDAVAAMAASDDWILDGAPYFAEDTVYRRVDTIVALDYPRWLVMARVVRRTMAVELLERSSGAHRRQGLRRAVRDPEHPVRWAWTSHRARHAEIAGLATLDTSADIKVFRAPHQAARWLSSLAPNCSI